MLGQDAVVAIGKAKTITGDYIKSAAAVINFGTNVMERKVVCDVVEVTIQGIGTVRNTVRRGVETR